MVTDDESDLDWADFHGEVAALGYPDLVLHGVVGLEDDGCVADRGDQYIYGAEETGCELLGICGHDWGDVLDVLLDATVSRLERTLALAGDPDSATWRVFVVDAGGGEHEQIGNWVYDPATNSVTHRRYSPAGGRQSGGRVLPSALS